MHNTHAISEVFTLQYKHEDVPQDKWLDSPENMEPELVMLLHNYRSIFKVPTELPLSRTHNHAIPLIKDAKPMKVRPYRYPHSKKQQIETMVQEMLATGITTPSTSPFSSPIILV